MNILSIQSHVVYGHVGNAAAIFPMQRLGHEVWPLHTVQFSNHPGYGDFRGETFAAALVDACIDGLAARDALARCDAILSGYLGAPDTGAAILRAVSRLKAQNPDALYCCDPVIGDVDPGVFVRPGIIDFFAKDALCVADIITPNHFELEILAGRKVHTLRDLREVVADLNTRGPKIVFVTSLAIDDTPGDAVDLAVSDGRSIWRVRTPRLAIAANGAGDAIAALFLVHFLATRTPDIAMARAASSVFGVLRRTMEAGSREMLLIEAQDEFESPTRSFEAVRL